MDLISLQVSPRKRCTSSSLEDSIILPQAKKRCPSEFNFNKISDSYRPHKLCSNGYVPSIAKKTSRQCDEEQMDCSNGHIEPKYNISDKHLSTTNMQSSKQSPKQHENSISNLYVASSYRRSPVKCSRCCAGEPGHFSHLTSTVKT